MGQSPDVFVAARDSFVPALVPLEWMLVIDSIMVHSHTYSFSNDIHQELLHRLKAVTGNNEMIDSRGKVTLALVLQVLIDGSQKSCRCLLRILPFKLDLLLDLTDVP